MNATPYRIFVAVPLVLLASLANSSLPRVLATPPAGTPPKATAAAPLALTAEKGLTTTTQGKVTWDFGTRAVRSGEVIAHTFTLRNSGAKPLHIESLLTSCHCTEATLILPPMKKGAVRAADSDGFLLAPGKSVGVRVAIDSATAHAGDFRKMVWVYVRGRDEAALTLTLAGTLTEATGID